MSNKFIGFFRIGLLIVSCLFGVKTLAGTWEDFGKIVSEQAQQALASKPTDKGRLNLLKIMQSDPKQLGRDVMNGIPWIDIIGIEEPIQFKDKGISGLKLKDSSITIFQGDLKYKSGEDAYNLVANTLVDFLKDQGANLPINGTIGPFFIAEILSGMNQKFNAVTAFGRFGLDYPTWIAEAGDDGRIWAEIIFVPRINSIIVKLSNEQMYMDMDNMESGVKKKLLTESLTIFNLKSGQVTFEFGYKFGDQKKVIWAQENPLVLDR